MSVRARLERAVEDRRVRRDFETLIAAQDFGVPRDALREEPPARRPGRRFIRTGLAVTAALVVLVVALVLAPLPYEPPAPLQTAFVFDRNGRLVARISAEEERTVVPLRRIPVHVRQAFVAAEDERFYRHPGVDVVAILRALWQDLTGAPLQGGSTITQQLIRNTSSPSLEDPTPGYVGRERTIWRKLHEAVLAVRMERQFSKAEILEMYMNQIYFGHGAYGVEAAAQSLFGEHVWRLSLAQAATLAGIAAGPARFSPRDHPGVAEGRRDWVLGRMAALGFVTEAEAAEARADPLQVVAPRPEVSLAPYFLDYLKRHILDRYDDDVLYRGGLRIETTLDLRLQRAAEQAIAGVLNQQGDPDAALVAIDVRSGGILAMVGGSDFDRSQVNLATGQGGSGRQTGSAFKPFVLAQALEEGISPFDVYTAPSSISIEGWDVENFGGASYGSLSVRAATVSSVNTVFAQLIDDVGPADVAELARRMGIRSPLPEVPSLTLGTGEVSPLEMTAAYATVASAGVYRPPTGIRRMVDSGGKVIERLDPPGRRALPGDTAEQVSDILVDVVASGTGTGAQVPGVVVAGKTGTAQDHADAWFCGYTAEVAACVWVGYKEGRIPMEGVHGISVTGGSLPAAIWRAFMSEVEPPETQLGTDPGSTGYESFEGSGSPSSAPTSGANGDPAQQDGSEGPPPDPVGQPPPSPPPQDGGEGDGGIIPDILPSPSG
jgi:penicillin-binding protein 1A